LGAKNFGWNNDFVRLVRTPLTELRVKPLPSVMQFNEAAKTRLGDDYVDVMSVVLDGAGTVPLFTPQGRFVAYDTNHLTKFGALFLGTQLVARFPVLAPRID